MKWFISLIFILFVYASVAQSSFTVKGQLVLASGELPSGNALLLHPKDSSLLAATFFLDGQFELLAVTQSPFLLQLSSLEFRDTIINIKVSPRENILQLGTITVASPDWELGTVVVKAMRAAYRQKADGTMELSVANTLLATSNSINEILSLTPEVLTDDEGNLSVMGKGAAIIFLDGQRILPEQLAAILPANIESIEIIRNPSARYDAEGNAVIHIHTINNGAAGQQLQLSQNAEYSSYAGGKMLSSVQAQLARRQYKLKGFYTFERGRDEYLQVTTRDRKDSSIFFSSEVATRWQPLLNQRSRYGMGMQYDLKTGTYLSLDYAGMYEDFGGSISVENRIIDNDGRVRFQNETTQSVIGNNQSLSLNFHTDLDSLGSNIFVGAQYNSISERMNNPILERSIENDVPSTRQLLNKDDRNIRIATAQLDWTKATSQNRQWEFGVKGSYINNGSITNFLIRTGEDLLERDERLSNLFQYSEYIGAAYAAWKGQWRNNWHYQLGIRSEYTNYALTVSGQSEDIADRYLSWFPNASLNYQRSEQYQFNLSYRAGINRQPYRNLNPVLIYQDPYTSIQGNPLLLPERVQAIELGMQLNRIQLKLGYNYTDSPIDGAALRGDDDRSYVLKRVNFDNRQAWYSSISRGLEWGFWSSNTTVSATYTRNSELAFGVASETPRINWYTYSSQQFQLPARFKLALVFWWQNDLYDGTTHRESSWNLTCSLERNFLDDQLEVRLIANDIFHTNRADGDYQVAETDITFRNKWNSNYFRLAITYRLGQIAADNYRNKKTGAKEAARGQ